LSGPPFRVFSPPGMYSFLCPYFLSRPPFRVFSPPGRSLLPKLPFQVFSLASSFFVYFFYFWIMTASCSMQKSSPECLAMFLFRNVTVLEVNVDVRFTYSQVQRECVCCSHFSKDVQKVFFSSSISIKNRRNFVKRINESSK